MNKKILVFAALFLMLPVITASFAQAATWMEKNNEKFQSFESKGTFNAGSAIGSADRTYVPSFDYVNKMISSWSENFISYEIKVGDKIYNLAADFEVSGYSEHIYWNPVFSSGDTMKIFPVASSASHTEARYTFDFLPASGIEGSFTIQTVVNEGSHRTTSISGTGDLRNVQIQATVSQIQARPLLTILNDGLVIGWPE